MPLSIDRGLLAGLLLCSTGCPDDTPPVADTTGEDSSTGTTTDMPTATLTPTMTGVDTGTGTGGSSSGPGTETSATETSDASGSSEGSSGSSSTGVPAVPEIEVSIDMNPLASGESFDIVDTVDVGVAGTPVVVTIENVGTGDLAVGGVTITAGDDTHFTLDDTMLDAVVAPAATTTFSIAFAPQNGGSKQISIEIDNDDADEAPYLLDFAAHTTENTYRQITPMSGPSARFNASMVDLQDGRLMLFGGRTAMNTRLDETWIFDVEAETWTQLAPPMSPPARDAQDMAYVGNDTVIMFGGVTGGGGGGGLNFGDTWAFDTVTEEWTNLMPPAGPSPRFQHAMVAVADDTVVLFGGRESFGVHLGDTWQYDAVTNTWTDLAPAGGIGIRSAPAMAFDGMGMITLFGGYDDDDITPGIPLDETWRYDVAGNMWTQGAPVMTPGPRFVLPGAHFADGTFIVFSGKLDSCCADPTAGTFAYDPAADDWADLAPPTEPTPRFNHSLAYVEGRNKAIIFGGNFINIGAGGAVDELWEYVGMRP